MKKIQIRYEWPDWYVYTMHGDIYLYKGLGYFLYGVMRIAWAIFLLLANALIRAYEYSVKAIRAYPCVAFMAAIIIALALHIVSYASVKTKLNTAEYQRDSIEIRLQRYEQFKN